MNTNLLGDIRERYQYGVEVYVDTERQVISTRPKQKPLGLRADDIDVRVDTFFAPTSSKPHPSVCVPLHIFL